MWINVAVCGFLTILLLRQVVGQLTVTPGEQEFSPSVSATCQAGTMTITVDTTSPFSGVIHARDYRKRECLASGDGGKSNIFRVNLYAKQNDSDFCGVVTKEQERSLPIAVRFHKTLELADDKFYVITCGRSGFRNSRNQSSDIYVKLMSENDRKLTELVYGREYKLRVGMTNPDGMFGFRVTSCFGFSGQNGTAAAQLVDKRGCPSKHVISKFEYDEKKGWADAKIFSMFRFAQTSEIHIQCEVVICKGSCGETVCDDDFDTIRDPILDTESTTALGTTSAFVVEPSTELISDCSFCGYQPPWLLYLCIAFGVLFLIMLIINIFLCSAMTCSCSRSEVIEKDPSIIDEYDPYRSWHGSHYGSRYSLNGAGGPVKNNGYLSAASTVHSTRSYSTNSDHYAIVHSRPGSGYSPNANGVRQTVPTSRHRGPGSTGSNYSGKDQRY